jgi:hypothetical protein
MLLYSGRKIPPDACSGEHPSQPLLRCPSQAAKKLNLSIMEEPDLLQHLVQPTRMEDLLALKYESSVRLEEHPPQLRNKHTKIMKTNRNYTHLCRSMIQEMLFLKPYLPT